MITKLLEEIRASGVTLDPAALPRAANSRQPRPLDVTEIGMRGGRVVVSFVQNVARSREGCR